MLLKTRPQLALPPPRAAARSLRARGLGRRACRLVWLAAALAGCGDKGSDTEARGHEATGGDITGSASTEGGDTGGGGGSTGGGSTDGGSTGGGTTDGGTGGGTDGGTGGGGSDEALFDALLAGEATLDEVLLRVAHSSGWPIRGAEGYLFVVADEGLGPYSLAGDHSGWTPEPMIAGEGFYYAVAEVPSPEGSLYKFVDRGGTYRADPWARAYGYDEYGEYSLVRGAGAHLERWPLVGDGVVDDRTLRVWVPEGAITHQLYVHDGQNLFDPEAPYGGWRLQDSLGPTTMAIGLDNTWARMDEYTHVPDTYYGVQYGGLGDAYTDYLQDTVRPLIEAEYGAAPTVGVLGSSLGGLIALYQDLHHPGTFDFVGSLSGTVGWGSIELHNPTVIELYAEAGHQDAVIYIDSGGGGGDGCVDADGDGIEDDARGASDNYCENLQLADTLEAAGYRYEVDLYHWWEPGADHNEAAWADRVWLPLSVFEAL